MINALLQINRLQLRHGNLKRENFPVFTCNFYDIITCRYGNFIPSKNILPGMNQFPVHIIYIQSYRIFSNHHDTMIPRKNLHSFK